MPDLLLKPVPHDEAAKFIASKPVLAREAFDNLLPDLKARAFTITGVEAANVMQNVRDRIAELPQGADWEAVKADVAAQISPWLDTVVDPSGDGERSVSPSERRAELLLRTHGFQAYTVAAEEVAERQRAAFPFAQYLSSDDDKVRESHAALDGLVVPADSPFWDRHTPPWEWGCRCNKVFLQADDVADMQKEDEKKIPEARRVLTAERLQRLETSNQVTIAGPGGMPQFVNVAPSKTFTFDRKTIKMNAEELRPRYDAETFSTFETWAKQQSLPETGESVWGWLNRAPGARGTRTKGPGTKGPQPTIQPPATLPPVTRTPAATPAAPAPVAPPAAPTPAAPSAPAVPAAPVPGPSTPTPAPVSAALEVRVAGPHAADVRTALGAIDRVHDDGELPAIPIIGQTGSDSLGIYYFPGGQPKHIGVRPAPGNWPAMTAAHETGHFLDHQTLGLRGEFASVKHPDLQGFRDAVHGSAAVAQIKKLPRWKQDYFLEGYELWARAYAQYIAKKSGDPLLVAQLAKIRGGNQPWRQWSEEDFAPIQTAIDDVFKKKGWLK